MGFSDVTAQVPDPRWAAAGDVIVYRWSEQNWEYKKKKKKSDSLPNYGHIDIRDYEEYISDFIPESHHPGWLFDQSRIGKPEAGYCAAYVDIRIYRKVYDPLPTLRIRAFLRCLREFECQAESDDIKRYRMLNKALPNVAGKTFQSYKTHPWATVPDSARGIATAAGAYQIVYSSWKEILDRQSLQLPDGAEAFSPIVQDKIAVIKIEERGVLHLIRAGKIEEALAFTSKSGGKGIPSLASEWTSLPGGKENTMRRAADGRAMDMPYFKEMFDRYVEDEIRKVKR
jgi:muramidase (phage lysozyme)